MALRTYWPQLFPSKPVLTERNLGNQTGKVFIVTGGNAGIGFELSKILYSKGAKVYMASRSQSKAEETIKVIQSNPTATPGELRYLHLDLDDLNTIKASAEAFAARERVLHVLWNNAGVAMAPLGSKTKQEYEIHVGTNCLGPYLFTQLLLPQLREAAKGAPEATVRIVWNSSMMVDALAPEGGIDFAELSAPSSNQNRNYAISKAGNWLLASEFARRIEDDGIISLTHSPGLLRTKAYSSLPKIVVLIASPLLHHPIYGAYTGLWVGLSSDVTTADSGRYAIPWGRWHLSPRKDILAGLKTVDDGGTGEAARFWNWCEAETKRYA